MRILGTLGSHSSTTTMLEVVLSLLCYASLSLLWVLSNSVSRYLHDFKSVLYHACTCFGVLKLIIFPCLVHFIQCGYSSPTQEEMIRDLYLSISRVFI